MSFERINKSIKKLIYSFNSCNQGIDFGHCFLDINRNKGLK